MTDLPVLQPWFTTEPVDERTTVIRERGMHRLLAANIWVVHGRDRDLVIDSGNGVASLRAALPRLFERDPVLVLTHAHMDHMGGAHEFDDVWVHADEAGRVQAPPTTVDLVAGEPLVDDGSLDGTALADLPELLIEAVPDASYDPSSYRLIGTPVTRSLGDGDVVDLGDISFTVLHLPGHSPGSIGLFDEASGTLFSGDVVYDGILLDTAVGSDISAYLGTMQQLSELPVRVVHGGHKPSFGRERLRTITADYLSRRG